VPLDECSFWTVLIIYVGIIVHYTMVLVYLVSFISVGSLHSVSIRGKISLKHVCLVNREEFSTSAEEVNGEAVKQPV